jgi:hypothetical protein
MEAQLSYSQIEVNGKYKIDNREIIVIDKHIAIKYIAIISCASDLESLRREERILYSYLNYPSTKYSAPFKDLKITY